MRKVVIIGIGMHPAGRFPEISLEELGRVAIWNAIKDANVPPKDIGAMFVANSIAGLITGQEGIRGQVIARYSGFGEMPIVNVENACAGGATALREAWKEVALGLCDVALALGAEKMYIKDNVAESIAAVSRDSQIDLAKMGYFFPGLYAMRARRWMAKYGITREQIAKVAVKNSYNGSLNPYAQYRTPRSLEEILNARIVTYPFSIYECSAISDGAAAAILCSEEKAREYADKPLVEIAAIALKSGKYVDPWESESAPTIAALAAREAYEKASIGPKDINVAEVHDAFSSAELQRYSDLGFCAPGEEGRMIDEGRTAINGDIPVNTDGGLIAKGHPISASSLSKVAEIVKQLRGEVGERQVPKDCKVGLTQCAGGNLEGDTTAAAVVTILKRI